MTKTYTQYWKAIPFKEKTVRDVVLHIALKAWFAKTTDTSRESIFRSLIAKSFTPVTREIKLNNGAHPYGAVSNTIHYLTFGYNKAKYGIFRLSFEDTVTKIFGGIVKEFEAFTTFLNEMRRELYLKPARYNKRYYSYIFVDQEEVDPIYQAVQAAHVAMVVGQKMDKLHNAENIYFQMCKMPSDPSDFHENVVGRHKTESFYEPDVDRIIAIATHPIRSDKRLHLKKYDLLSFAK